MSWGDVVPVTAAPNEALFTLHFTATTSGSLKDMVTVSSAVTDAEAYTTDATTDVEIMDVALNIGKTVSTPALEYALYQNEPNPFADQTVIGFDLPAAMPATLTVYDITGRVVKIVEGDYVKGYNEIILKGKDLVSEGAYYYRLNAGDFTASKKMILTR